MPKTKLSRSIFGVFGTKNFGDRTEMRDAIFGEEETFSGPSAQKEETEMRIVLSP
jgi:hypothetical protein